VITTTSINPALLQKICAAMQKAAERSNALHAFCQRPVGITPVLNRRNEIALVVCHYRGEPRAFAFRDSKKNDITKTVLAALREQA